MTSCIMHRAVKHQEHLGEVTGRHELQPRVARVPVGDVLSSMNESTI